MLFFKAWSENEKNLIFVVYFLSLCYLLLLELELMILFCLVNNKTISTFFF